MLEILPCIHPKSTSCGAPAVIMFAFLDLEKTISFSDSLPRRMRSLPAYKVPAGGKVNSSTLRPLDCETPRAGQVFCYPVPNPAPWRRSRFRIAVGEAVRSGTGPYI